MQFIPVTTPVVVTLSWELFQGKKIDLDISAVIFDKVGSVIGAVYYNQATDANGGVVHSGDTKGETNLERVVVDVTKVPPNVHAIMIIANCFSPRQTFANAETARVEVANPAGQVFGGVSLGGLGIYTAALVQEFFRDLSGNWFTKTLGLACFGSHFVDSIPYSLQIFEFEGIVDPNLISERKPVPTFPLNKGQSIAVGTKKLLVGLGWDAKPGEDIDLDASVIMFSYTSKKDHVWFKDKQSLDKAVIHRGDSRDGKGDGDDEKIEVNLKKVNPVINNMLIVVTIFTEGKTFLNVKGAYVRLVDLEQKSEICKFELVEIGAKSALIFAKLYRQTPDNWCFEAIGEQADGRAMDQLLKASIIGPYVVSAPPPRHMQLKISNIEIEGELANAKKNIDFVLKYGNKKENYSMNKTQFPIHLNDAFEGISIIFSVRGTLTSKHLGDIHIVLPNEKLFHYQEKLHFENCNPRTKGSAEITVDSSG